MRKCANCGFIRLSKMEWSLWDFAIRKNSITVRDVAKEFGYTLAVASTMLKELVDNRVLRRSRKTQKNRYRPTCWVYESAEYKKRIGLRPIQNKKRRRFDDDMFENE